MGKAMDTRSDILCSLTYRRGERERGGGWKKHLEPERKIELGRG